MIKHTVRFKNSVKTKELLSSVEQIPVAFQKEATYYEVWWPWVGDKAETDILLSPGYLHDLSGVVDRGDLGSFELNIGWVRIPYGILLVDSVKKKKIPHPV